MLWYVIIDDGIGMDDLNFWVKLLRNGFFREWMVMVVWMIIIVFLW